MKNKNLFTLFFCFSVAGAALMGNHISAFAEEVLIEATENVGVSEIDIADEFTVIDDFDMLEDDLNENGKNEFAADPADDTAVISLIMGKEIVDIPFEEFYPVEEEKQPVLLSEHKGCFVLHVNADEKKDLKISFNQKIKEKDIQLLYFDPYHSQVDVKIYPGENVWQKSETGISLFLQKEDEFILLINHADDYQGLAYTSKQKLYKIQKSEEISDDYLEIEAIEIFADEEENEQALFSENESELDIVKEIEPETSVETELQSVQQFTQEENPAVDFAEIIFAPDINQIPARFLSVLKPQELYKLQLHYADGTVQKIETGKDTFGNRVVVQCEDIQDSVNSLLRTYTVSVFQPDSETEIYKQEIHPIQFNNESFSSGEVLPVESKVKIKIDTEQEWILIRTVPRESGIYTMNCFGKNIDKMYYSDIQSDTAAEAEGEFELQGGETYLFLIKLQK